jgi:hypothetical protein
MRAEGLAVALADYQRAQDQLVEARNRLARAIAGAAMSGVTRDEIVDLTGYPAERVLRILRDARLSGEGACSPPTGSSGWPINSRQCGRPTGGW